MEKRKALGRGLGALIPNVPVAAPVEKSAPEGDPKEDAPLAGSTGPSAHGGTADRPAGPTSPPAAAPAQREFFLCPIEEVVPSADNPRRLFNEERMEELATSIRSQGLVQPLVVRLRSPEEIRQDLKNGGTGASFVLIAGERRWRAAQKAGLKDVSVVVKDVNAARAFELALVENLQREDLNAIEEAEAYRRLSEEFGYTQEELAQRVGRARETVTNALRLLKLPETVRQMVAHDELSMGHARALLGLEDDAAIHKLAQHVTDKKLSVRQTELLVRKQKELVEQADKGGPASGEEERRPEKSPAVRDLEDRLQKSLGTRVRLQVKDAQAGRIEIEYHSLDQLDDLIRRFIPREGD